MIVDYSKLINHLNDKEINVVDVGVRNGMSLLGDLSKFSNLYGFEANPDEYQKLLNNKTDLQQSGGVLPFFKKTNYFCKAITNKIDEELDFFITNGPGACTLAGKSNKLISENIYLDINNKSYEEEHTKILKKIKVTTDTLDNIFSDTKIDFLKIDAEGMDYFVLEGASKLLKEKKILVLKTEALFFSMFEKDVPLLGDQISFMRDSGYRLIHLDSDHSGYLCDKTEYPLSSDKRPKYACDAYFIPEFQKTNISEEQHIRISIILCALGFNSLAKYCLQKSNRLSQKEVDFFFYQVNKKNYKKRILYYWNLLPILIKRLVLDKFYRF
jgi:FkbM family methyltransferase